MATRLQGARFPAFPKATFRISLGESVRFRGKWFFHFRQGIGRHELIEAVEIDPVEEFVFQAVVGGFRTRFFLGSAV
ncbi:MAG: hypothetical protein JO151_14930 [Verrucomicrobia bacterium]|nr:hypothetical protein [Verrucomicrobiota bacterium]